MYAFGLECGFMVLESLIEVRLLCIGRFPPLMTSEMSGDYY